MPDRDACGAKKAVLPAHDLGDFQFLPPASSQSSSWQQHETILEFLRRLPVADPDTARVGPWLWVHCSRELQDRSNKEDLNTFIETASPLLEGLRRQRVIIEQQNPGKAGATITRKLGPYRDQLETISLASGVWRLVAEATAEGKLGPTSKVGTWEPNSPTKGTLICVYTKDFSDLVDVKRVMCALIDFGIAKRESRIYYKCDAYTYLDIKSGNEYKLPASLYSSEDVLEDKVKYRDGVIIRSKKGSLGLASDIFP